MKTGLTDRTALVLGGGSGLGRAIALALAAEGARVAVAGRTLDTLAETVRLIRDSGGDAHPYAIDLAQPDAFGAVLDALCKELGPVEILVNNTGGPPPSTAAGVAAEQWIAQFRTMVLGVVLLTDLVLPRMRDRRWGRIITSTSSGVIAPIPNLGLSNALRSSLMGWSKTLAREVAPDGITVNVLVPGRIDTDRVRRLDAARAEREGTSVEQAERSSIAAIPAGRYGRPEEYGAAAAFLASDLASYITGSTLRVDGGLIPSI